MSFLTVFDDLDAIESFFSSKNSDEIGLFCVSHFLQNKRSVYEKFKPKIKNAENFSTKALPIEVVLFANLMKCTGL